MSVSLVCVCVCVCYVTDSNPGIVGGAIVVVALVLLAIIGAVVLVRKHRDKQRRKGCYVYVLFIIYSCIHAPTKYSLLRSDTMIINFQTGIISANYIGFPLKYIVYSWDKLVMGTRHYKLLTSIALTGFAQFSVVQINLAPGSFFLYYYCFELRLIQV